MAQVDLVRWMETFLREEEAADRFSGVVAIEQRDELVFRGAYGQAHRGFGVPNTFETRFNLASITKMFTAVAVLQLREQGKLALEDVVSKHLPDLKLGGIDRMTIGQLLSHTSGLGSYWNEKCKQRRSQLRTIRAYLELIEGEEPFFEPGSAAEYSNTGYLVLGAVIEAASGRDYYDYVEEHVCRRADMARTAFLQLDHIADFAHGYTYVEWEGPAHPDYRTDNIFQYPVRGNPSGWLYSTAAEMLRFGAALRCDRLLSRAARELMFAIQSRGAKGERFGYGTQHISYSRGTAVGHGGRAFGAATVFMFLPEAEYTVCVLANVDRPADKRAFKRLDEWLVKEITERGGS